MKKWIIVFVIAISSLTYAQGEKPARVLRIGIQNDISTITPHKSLDTITSSVLMTMFEGLVRYKLDSYEVEPALAVSWKHDSSFKIWTYNLRKGVKFHDGSPMNAEAVVESFRNVSDFQGSAEQVDDTTVRFTLPEGNSKFTDLISNPSYHVVHPDMLKGADKIIGTGPYRFESRKKGKMFSVIPNPEWWSRLPKPGLDRIEFVVFPSESAIVAALGSGEIHIAEWLTGNSIRELKKHKNLRMKNKLGNNVGYLTMNTSRPPFDNVDVRRAVSYALNPVELTHKFFTSGTGVPAKSFVPPTLFSYPPSPQINDPEKARQILKKMGYKPEKPLVLLEIWAPRPYMPQPHGIAVEIKKQLEEVGFSVEVVSDPDGFFDRVFSGNFDMCLAGWIADYADPISFVSYNFHTKSIGHQNLPRWSNPEFDRLIELAQTQEGMKFKLTFQKALQILEKEVPTVPLFWGSQVAAWSNRVKGYSMHPSSYINLRETTLK